MTSLETEIARLKGNKDPATITELILDKCSAAKLQGNEFDDFPSLTTLSLNSVGLASLDKFPPLQHLKRLDLNDNKIAGGLEALQDAGLIHLAVLNLANNRIKSLDDIGPLGGLPSLRCLDLTRCEVTSAENYRATVFESIPSLKILDGLNEEGDEVDYDEEEEEDDDEEEDGGEDDEDDDIDDIEDGDEDGEEEDEYGEGEEDEDFLAHRLNTISVQTNGLDAVSTGPAHSRASVPLGPHGVSLADGREHSVRVVLEPSRFNPGKPASRDGRKGDPPISDCYHQLSVFVDDDYRARLSVQVDLNDWLHGVEKWDGKMFVGLTASTGRHYSEHSVTALAVYEAEGKAGRP